MTVYGYEGMTVCWYEGIYGYEGMMISGYEGMRV